MTALDRNWHPEHFFCAQCGAFFGPEGKLPPFISPFIFLPSLFFSLCLASLPLFFSFLSALSSRSVVLRQCLSLLPPTGFHEKDGKAYCRKDYFDMFAPKCGGCTRAILENYISALNSLWHPECFVCRVSGCGLWCYSKRIIPHLHMV